jgi:predicted PurR-regulated permease PerM
VNEEVQPRRSQVRPRTVLVVCATVLAVVAVVYFVIRTQLAITLTLTGGVLALALDRPVKFLEKLKVPRGLAIAITFLLVLGVIVAVAFLIIPTAVEQAQALVEQWPDIVKQVQGSPLYQRVDGVLHLSTRLQHVQQGASELVMRSVGSVFTALGAIFAAGFMVTTVLFVTLFMLIWAPGLIRRAMGETLPRHRPLYERILGKIYGSVGGYIAGLIVLAGLNATFATIFLAILGVPFFLPLGILSGLGSLVPLVGATAAGVIIAIVGAATKSVWIGVIIMVYNVSYQQVENHVFAPVIYKRTADLNPLVTLLAVVYFAELSGLIGALLAVPLVAIGQILLVEALALRRERLDLPPPPKE